MPEVVCDCCGKVFRRRASAIKRRKNNFCSLKCAYKYRTCDIIIVSNEEFKQYYDKYKLLLYKYAWSYEYVFFDDLMQEALIVLWQTIDKFKNKRIKNNFYSYLNVALKNHLKLYYIRNLKFNNSIHFSTFENPDFLEFTAEKINELNLDFNNFLNKIENYSQNELCLSEKMLLEKELKGATYEYLSKKYGVEIPRIQKNIYAAKTLLRKKFKEQVKYLKEVA